jgi:predicted site-specific integrase-resolvase
MPALEIPIEWARARQVFIQFGIGRSTLDRLAREGKIKCKTLKGRFAKKGIRVFNVSSIRELLASNLS